MEDASAGGCQPHLVKKVVACFVNMIFSLGPIYGFSVFLPFIKADLGISLPEVAAIGSTLNTATFVGSFSAGITIPQRAGHASVALIGAIGVSIGLASLSMIEKSFAAYAAVLLAGLGLGSTNLAGLVALNATVAAKKRATFVGFASCGTSVGTMLLPHFYTLLTEAMDWRWAMRINSAVSCVFLAAAAPFFRVQENQGLLASPTSTRQVGANLGIQEVMRDPRFLCWWLNMFLCFLGFYLPPTLLAEFARNELHLSANLTAVCYSLIGVSGLFTRLSLGCLTHLLGGPRRLFFMAQLLVGALACCLPFCRNAESLLVWSAVYGSSIGPIIALVSVVLSDLFGTKDLALYHGCSRTGVGVGNLLGIPLLSLLAEQQGFTVALILSGALVSFSTVFLIVLELLHRKKLRDEVQEGTC